MNQSSAHSGTLVYNQSKQNPSASRIMNYSWWRFYPALARGRYIMVVVVVVVGGNRES